MSYRCCDCGEIKASKPEIESHINADHIGWTPYQCFYCNQNGITTRKPSKSMLRDHVTERHPDQQFTYLYTDDEAKNELLKDMILRSTLDQQPAQVNASPISLAVSNASSHSSSTSPFVISSFEPKDEVVDITNDSPKIKDIDIITIDDDDEDVDGNVEKPAKTDSNQSSASGNFRCETCRQVIPRNLLSIRDHIKLHFKEKTGCFPVDLKKLPYTLQQIYYNLFVTSFPVEGASILRNDIVPNLVPTVIRVKKEPEPESVHHVAISSASGVSPSHTCKTCGKQFEKLSSLSIHEKRWCKEAEEMDHSAVTYDCKKCGKQFDKLASLTGHQNRCGSKKTQKVLSKSHTCPLCDMRFVSVRAFSNHKCSFTTKKRVSSTSYMCYRCNKRFESQTVLNAHICCSPMKKHVGETPKLEKITPKTERKIPKTLKKTPKSEKKTPKTEKKRPETESTANVSTVCNQCNRKFNSTVSLRMHRASKHGITGQSYCKKCKITVSSCISIHILKVHMMKKIYECSICKSCVSPNTVQYHDLRVHKGLGKSRCIKNIDLYQSEIEDLRKRLIIGVDTNLPSKSPQKLIVKFKPKVNKLTSLNQLPHSKNDSTSSRDSANVTHAKYVNIQEKTKKNVGVSSTTCDVCNKRFTNKISMHIHRGKQHHNYGNGTENHCKKCKINVRKSNSDIDLHILNFHMNKRSYECSMCKKKVSPCSIDNHDLHVHGGYGKARCIHNLDKYEYEIRELRKQLMGPSLHPKRKPGRPRLASKQSDHMKKLSNTNRLQSKIHNEPVETTVSHSNNEQSSRNYPENVAKCDTVQLKPSLDEPMKNQMGTKCNLCRKSFPSSPQMYFHQREKHGLPVQWHCKECKINMRHQYITQHLLFVHLSKYQYKCSLCDDIGIFPANIALHDKTRHGGEGNAKIIKNSEQYEQELKELHTKFIVEANSTPISETDVTTPEKMKIGVPSINRQEMKTKFQSKLVNRSDNAKWLSRFKQSQRRKCLDPNHQVHKNVAFKKNFTKGFACAVKLPVVELTEELLNNGSACFPSASSSVTPSTIMTSGSETNSTAIQPFSATTASETSSNATGTNDSTGFEISVSKTATAQDKMEAASAEIETTKLMAETVQVEMETAPSEILTSMPITEPVQVESETVPADIEATEPATETVPTEPEITVQITETVQVNSKADLATIEASDPTTETVQLNSEPAPAEIETMVPITEPVQVESETAPAEIEATEPVTETVPLEPEITVQTIETVQVNSEADPAEIEASEPTTETVQVNSEPAPAEIVTAMLITEPVQIEGETTPTEMEINEPTRQTTQVEMKTMLMTETIQVERETAPAEIITGIPSTEHVQIVRETAADEIKTALPMTETINAESETSPVEIDTTMPMVETAQAEMESGMLTTETAQSQSEAAKPETETFTSTIERVEAEDETTLAEAEVTMPRTEIPQAESETAMPITETVQVECGTAPTEIEASELMTEILHVESGTAEAEVTVPGAEITQAALPELQTTVLMTETVQVESGIAPAEIEASMPITGTIYAESGTAPTEIETSEPMTETIQVETRTAQAEIVETAIPMTETEQVENETAPAEIKATMPATKTPSAEIETTILMAESVQVEMETDPVESETTMWTVETTPIEMETTGAEATGPTNETLQTEKETVVAEFETSMPMTDVIEAEMATNLAATETVLGSTEAAPTEMETAPAEHETITSTIDTTQAVTEATVPTTETPQVGSETSSAEIDILMIESVHVEMETDPVEPETTMQMVETSPIEMETTVAEAAVPTNEALQTETETAAAEIETSMLMTDVIQAEISTNLPATETVLQSNEAAPTEMEPPQTEADTTVPTLETALPTTETAQFETPQTEADAAAPTLETALPTTETPQAEADTAVLTLETPLPTTETAQTETPQAEADAAAPTLETALPTTETPQAEADTAVLTLETALPTTETPQMETEPVPGTFWTGWPF